MKVNIFLVIFTTLVSVPLFGSRVVIGPEARSIEVSSQSKTLLSFPLRPIASSCQPGNLSFKTLHEDGVSSIEKRMMSDKEQMEPDLVTDSKLGLFLKMTPLKKSGKSSCVFTLEDGSQVPVIFVLKNNIVRPLIEFVDPPKSKSKTYKEEIIEATRAMVSMTGEEKAPMGYAQIKLSSNDKKHKSKIGNYSLQFMARNDLITIAKLDVILSEDIDYHKFSNIQRSGVLTSTLVVPQKQLKAGEEVKLYMTFYGSLSQQEVFEVLP